MRRIVLFLMQTRAYRYLMRYVVPKIRFSTSYGHLTGKHYKHISDMIEPGDVIQVSDPWKLTGLLIPGWDHSELVLDDEGNSVGCHAEGLRYSLLFDTLKECKEVRILRCKDRAWAEFAALNGAELFERNKINPITYDLMFSLGVEALYCHELIMFCYPMIRFDLSDAAGLGLPYLSALGIAENEAFQLVFDSTKDKL